jgi:hypothetical protein
MRRGLHRILAGGAVAVGAVGLVSAPATGAGAATPTAGRTVCHGVSGHASSPTAKLRGCTPATTGGSGIIAATTGGGGDVVTWANGGSTTLALTGTTPVTPSACAAGDAEEHFTAKVTASTGAASAITGKVSAYLCVPPGSGSVSLVPKTTFTF